MSDYVVDASVVVKWFLPEPFTEAARRLRGESIHCSSPDLLLLEVPNVLWKYVVRGTLDLATAKEAVNALSVAPIRVHGADSLFADAFRLAVETRRSVYDCTYLALAIQEDCSLVTADRKFYDALQTGPFAPRLLWIGDLQVTA
ncbi:MAG: PIN domain nuclease [Acidobacteria bacterium]|nr:MAG: PIN domain nuclease [Acidobacteriota bacterium]